MNYDGVPRELRERPNWAVWRSELRDGKATKVPHGARQARPASSTDPATWCSFDEAVRVAGSGAFDGIGYMLAADDPYTGIDLDRCLADGRLDQRAQAIVTALASFCEISPSGTGVKLLVRGTKNGITRCRARAAWGGEVEIYDRDRFWTITGNPFPGTPATIENRQPQLNGLMRAAFPAQQAAEPRAVQPVDLDDRDLIEKAKTAANGPKFSALWDGDTGGYPSRSEADIALCDLLAFWTGRDPDRIDRLFRASGLMRDKWLRDDYRERTIRAAIASTLEVYAGTPVQVRPASDAPGTHSASGPGDGAKSAGASRVPHVKGTQGRDALSPPPVVDAQEPLLQVEEAGAFAAVDEASAEPLLGDDENTLLAADGSAAYYGDGGAGKTTLGLDRAVHLCAGRDWLGVPVRRPVRVLWIENEGPRGKFRKKLRAKLNAWDGPSIEGRLHVLTAPWARFTFANERMRAELVDHVWALEIEVVIAGPVSRLGAEGGGTPKEIQAFVDLLEQVRADLGRPLAYELIHHENKQGNVSGAWEGATDTLAHVQARGNGHTAIVWRKARWAHDLHGKTWKLEWRDGERFERDETPETSDEEIVEKLLELVRETPGGSWNTYDPLIAGNATRKRTIRDQLLADGRLVNTGTPKAMSLYLPEQVDEMLLSEEPAA